jgi:hypothetical protein
MGSKVNLMDSHQAAEDVLRALHQAWSYEGSGTQARLEVLRRAIEAAHRCGYEEAEEYGRKYLHSCPYCGHLMNGHTTSGQISHLIQCADKRIWDNCRALYKVATHEPFGEYPERRIVFE